MPEPASPAPYIDLADALARLRGNKKIYKTLLLAFQKDKTLEQLKEQAARGDLAAAATSAHTLKGVAGNLSLKALYECALQAEAALKAGDTACLNALGGIWETTLQQIEGAIAGLE